MANANRTYSDLLALVQALAGVDAFAPTELPKVQEFINSRIRAAYDSSPTWPRYIVGGEVRPAIDGLVEYTYVRSARFLESATRSGTTVTVVATVFGPDFTAAPGMTVNVVGLVSADSPATSPNGTFTVTAVSGRELSYEITAVSGMTASETYTIPGAPYVIQVELTDIEDFFRIWSGNPYGRSGSRELNYYVDSSGAHLDGASDGVQAVYVAYKKNWGGPYTSSSTDIPQEFFQYAARAAYSDFLRMDGQTDKAGVEEQQANRYLTVELDKAAQVANNNRVFGRVRTCLSSQSYR